MARSKAPKSAQTDPDDVVKLSDDERTTASVRGRQFPSLYADGEDGRPGGGEAIEVAERSQDVTDTGSTTTHRKVFTTTRAAWETPYETHDAVHARNFTAVRQFMVSQGLRPDAKVVFAGAEDHEFDKASVNLVYTVEAVPAVVATDFDLAHTVISSDGPTPTERAENEAKRAETVANMRDPLRELGNEKADPDVPVVVDEGRGV